MICKEERPTCQCLTCKKGEAGECCELEGHIEMIARCLLTPTTKRG